MTTPTTDLYFEAHVTIAPVEGKREELLRKLCHAYQFRLADLLMRKNRAKSPYDSFCTGRSNNYPDIYDRTTKFVKSLECWGFEVWRYKIENTLMDVITDSHPRRVARHT